MLITIVAGLIGALFGFLTARWLTRRLQILAAVTDAWGRGDFSVVIKDRSSDELGQLAVQLNSMAGQVQGLLHAREHLAVLEERHRLARDLHDSVTQALYSINLYAEALARQLAGGDTVAAGEHARELGHAAREALCEMRVLVYELRPPELESRGLIATLQDRLEAVEERSGIETEFLAEGGTGLAPELEEGLYRIAQEALNNALKHARPTRIVVCLHEKDDMVVLEVRDNGLGFDPAAGEQGGLGLKGMAERAVRMGGGLTVDSICGGGTLVRVEVRK